MSTSSEKDFGQTSSPSKTYIRHRVQSYVNTVEGVDPSREEYETEIPAEDGRISLIKRQLRWSRKLLKYRALVED